MLECSDHEFLSAQVYTCEFSFLINLLLKKKNKAHPREFEQKKKKKYFLIDNSELENTCSNALKCFKNISKCLLTNKYPREHFMTHPTKSPHNMHFKTNLPSINL